MGVYAIAGIFLEFIEQGGGLLDPSRAGKAAPYLGELGGEIK